MPIQKDVEVCGCETITIHNREIIRRLDQKDAIEIIEGLLKKFPDVVDTILHFTKNTEKLYPKGLKDALEQKYKKENKAITSF